MPPKYPAELDGHFPGFQGTGTDGRCLQNRKRTRNDSFPLRLHISWSPHSSARNPPVLCPSPNPAGSDAPVNRPGFGSRIPPAAVQPGRSASPAAHLLSESPARGAAQPVPGTRSRPAPLGAVGDTQTLFLPTCSRSAKTSQAELRPTVLPQQKLVFSPFPAILTF